VLNQAIVACFILAVIAVTAITTSYFAGLPESNCLTSPVSELWSEDRVYKATVLLKDCNKGETIFYSVRVDFFPPPPRGGWFTRREINDDERPLEAPDVRWEAPRTLLIQMKTRTLGGSMREHVGDDLTIVQNFTARAPDAFPN
jgi:hypothetical protein